MAMTKCKECGGEVSSKAETCPKCGFRLKGKTSGCLVSIFKLIGGLIGGVVGLLVAVSFTTGGGKTDVVKELESRCRARADSFPIPSERQDFYSNCISSGMTELKSKGVLKP